MTLLHVLHMLSPLVIYFSDRFCFALRGTKIIMKKNRRSRPLWPLNHQLAGLLQYSKRKPVDKRSWCLGRVNEKQTANTSIVTRNP